MRTDHLGRRVWLLPTVLLTCGLLAACGSSATSSSSTTANAAASSSPTAASRAGFRDCLKAHGVTLPSRRPGSGRPRTPGAGGLFGGGGGFARNPKLAAAVRACGGGRFAPGAGRRFRLSHQAVNAFVACVRKHGYNLPDPNFSGTGPVFPAGIRTNPKFVAAAGPCTRLLTPSAPAPPLPQSTS